MRITHKKGNPIYYGWVIVGAGMALLSVTAGIVLNCLSLFTVPVCADLGLSRSAFSGLTTATYVGVTAVTVFAGKIYRRVRMLSLMKLCLVVQCACYFCFSLCRNAIAFYLLSAVIGVCYGLLTFVPVSIIINNWFYKKSGFAMGLAFMGSGLGGMVFNLVTGALLESIGWRSTFQVLAVLIFVVAAPCIFFLLKATPEEKGLLPYGKNEANGCADAAETEGVGLQQAMRTGRFWVFCVALFLTVLAMNTFSTTVSPRICDSGYTVTYSSAVMSLSLGVVAVGKIILGKITDRCGFRAAGIAALLFLALGFCGSIFSIFQAAHPVIVIGFGIGCAFGSVAAPLAAKAMYGTRDYAAINGVYSSVVNMAVIFAPLFSAWFYDNLGSYNWAYYPMLLVTLLLVPFYLFFFKSRARKADAAKEV